MRIERHYNFSGHLLVGALLMAIGGLFLLDNLNIVDSRLVIFRGWPVILIVLGLAKVVSPDNAQSRVWGAVLIVLGSLFLLSRFGYLPFSVWGLIWPLALISFGLYLVVRSRYSSKAPAKDTASRINVMAFMGGVERKCTSQQFEGGELTAVMGGCEIDLRHAEIAGNEAVLEIFVLAGGIELFIPEGWSVQSKVFPIMGAFEEHAKPVKDAAKTLQIRGLVLMGGVEVKNY